MLEFPDIVYRGIPYVKIDGIGSPTHDSVFMGVPWIGRASIFTPATQYPFLVTPFVPAYDYVANNDPTKLLLANVYVGTTVTIDALSLIDTRQRGGGLEPDISLRNKTLTPEQKRESVDMWDVGAWDGNPSLINGKIVIKVPSSKLIENGGNFTREQIDEIINRNIPIGVHPIVQYV